MIKRERQLYLGDTGSGKTRVLFNFAVRALESGRKVFFISLDNGHVRFMPKVERWSSDPDKRFFEYNCSSWIELRDSMREVRSLWEHGDWVLQDRVDLAWDYIQRFYKAERYGINEERLPDFVFDKRLDWLKEADKLEKSGDAGRARSIRNAINMDGPTEMDWDLQKSAMSSVTYEIAAGREAQQYEINYIATAWAVSGITARTSGGGSTVETDASKNDPRKLRLFNITIQGEKHVPGYFDTVLVLRKLPQGYTLSTEKDRERTRFVDEIIGEDGVVDLYQSLTGASF